MNRRSPGGSFVRLLFPAHAGMNHLPPLPARRVLRTGMKPVPRPRGDEPVQVHAVDPYAYLRETLTAIVNGHPASRFDDLMPWAFQKQSS